MPDTKAKTVPPESDLLVGFKEGDAIYGEGDAGDTLFIIAEGEVELTQTSGDSDISLAALTDGDFFGELSALEALDRCESARATTACRLLPIDAGTLEQLLKENPEILQRMLRRLARRLHAQTVKTQTAMEVARKALQTDSGGVETAPSAPPRVRFLHAELHHESSHTVFTIEAAREYTLGRFDPATKTAPDVDLTPMDGQRSLSRRHARVVCRDDQLFLREEERGTANGTFADGQRLKPGDEVPVGDGEHIKLGFVELVVRHVTA